MVADPGAVTPARARTRRAVLDAAATVFATRGYHGATMQEIATTAGYTQGAIYANFGGKADLFLEVVDDRMARQRTDLDEVVAAAPGSERLAVANAVGRRRLRQGDTESEVLLGLEVLLHAVREHPDLRQALARRYRAADDATGEVLVRAVPGLSERGSEAVDRLVLVHALLLEGLRVRWLADPDLLSTEEAAMLVEQVMSAVGSALLEHG